MAVDRALNAGDIVSVKLSFIAPLDKFVVKDCLVGILDTTTVGLNSNPVTKEAVNVLEMNGPARKATFLAACSKSHAPAVAPVLEAVSTVSSTPVLEQIPSFGSGTSSHEPVVPSPTDDPSEATPHTAPEEVAAVEVQAATSS
jgi:hypothetical protein